MKKIQPFSKQRGGQREKNIAAIMDVMKVKSGGDMKAFLVYLLFTNQIAKAIVKEALDKKEFGRTKSIVNNVVGCAYKQDIHMDYLSLISKVVSKDDAEKMSGIHINEKTWTRARKHAKTVGPGTPLPKPQLPQSKQPASKALKNSILNFLNKEESSRPSPNRFITKRGVTTAVKFLNGTKDSLYRLYSEATKNTALFCSRSQFIKLIPKWFKSSKRSTDMCGVCKSGKLASSQLEKLKAIINPTQVQLDLIQELQPAVDAYNAHRDLNQQRKIDFKRVKHDLKVGEAILISDFKENVSLNRGEEELGSHFFNRPQRSVFCVVLLYKRIDGGEVHQMTFDFVSEVLNHDPHFVSTAWDSMFQMDEFKDLNVKALKFWSDNAPTQFRTFENVDYWAKLNKRFEVNFKSIMYNFINQLVFYRFLLIISSNITEKDSVMPTSRLYLNCTAENRVKNPKFSFKLQKNLFNF
jgi:hypothetical protein